MLPDIAELMWKDLNAQIVALKTQLATSAVRSEQAQVAGGFANVKLANLPTLNNTSGDVYWCSDGRKVGEGVGAGTGTIVYWNGATSQWFRVRDDTPAVN